MDYTEIGYDEFLSRVPQSQGNSISSLAFDNFTSDLSGSKVQGGVMQSNDGKVKIDLDSNSIIVSDGIAERVRLGTLPDDKIGLLIKDKDGNILMQISEGLNVIQSGSGVFQIDIDNERLVFYDEKKNPRAVLGVV
jgi:hypothetical protein